MILFKIILVALLGIYVLSKRVGEVGTENYNLTRNLREYQNANYRLKKENEELKRKKKENEK